MRFTLSRPDYLLAPNLEAWVKLNGEALAKYWVACDAAVVASGGPAAPIDEWEWFVRAQYDSQQREFFP